MFHRSITWPSPGEWPIGTEDTANYYRRRAEEELAAAEQADGAGTADIHREMAKLYRERTAMLEAQDAFVMQLRPDQSDGCGQRTLRMEGAGHAC